MAYHTVIEFRHVDFDKNWNRSLLSAERIVEYSPLIDRAQLQIVTEGATGVATTYFFEVTKKEKVWVSIPYTYLLSAPRNNMEMTECLG